jgi:hypothetical protein
MIGGYLRSQKAFAKKRLPILRLGQQFRFPFSAVFRNQNAATCTMKNDCDALQQFCDQYGTVFFENFTFIVDANRANGSLLFFNKMKELCAKNRVNAEKKESDPDFLPMVLMMHEEKERIAELI